MSIWANPTAPSSGAPRTHVSDCSVQAMGVGVMVGVSVGTDVAVGVFVGTSVGDGVDVGVNVGVFVGTGVSEGVSVTVGVGVICANCRLRRSKLPPANNIKTATMPPINNQFGPLDSHGALRRPRRSGPDRRPG